MKLASLFKKLLPREERFHELFEEDVANLRQSAELFVSLARAEDLPTRSEQAEELKELERRGDEITRRIFETLNTTFLTPIDREDIRDLASAIDNVLDLMELVGASIRQFKLAEAPKELGQMSDILLLATEEIEKAVPLIWDLEDASEAQKCLIRISDLENEADEIFNEVVTYLFDETSGLAPLDVMKWKQIYQSLEDSIDRCKDVAHAVGNIVTKNA